MMANTNLNLWLVDDDEDDRLFFSEGLESLNYRNILREFINGKEALISLEKNIDTLPDIIFLDLNMPIMDGLETLDYIRKSEKLKHIIIAIYSTSSAMTDIQRAYDKGANLYVIKPCRFLDLKNCMQKILSMNWPDFLCNFKKEDFLLKV
tara:strand:+ start:1474 stop:1923 length:450 start_codon:yes stop_codon:yes gene_type:complete